MDKEELAGLLAPVSEDSPCGPDFSEATIHGDIDLAYNTLVSENLGSMVSAESGGRTSSEELLEWKELQRQIKAYFAQSKHLTIGAMLAVSLLRVRGLDGLKEGLGFVKFLVDKFWDSVHPSAEDEEERMSDRIAALEIFNDSQVIKMIREAEVFPGLEPKTLVKDVLEGGASEKATASLRLQFQTVPSEKQEALISGLEELRAGFKDLESKINGYAEQASDFDGRLRLGEVEKVLGMARQIVPKLLTITVQTSEQGTPEERGDGSASEPRQGVQSRDDVVMRINEICRYYESNEPGSPIPLLLHRAKRMVPMDFKQICAEFALNNGTNLDTLFGKGVAEPGGSASVSSII